MAARRADKPWDINGMDLYLVAGTTNKVPLVRGMAGTGMLSAAARTDDSGRLK